MNRCPVCSSEAKPEFIEKYGSYTINRCPDCDVFFSDPMKNPGADWYEKSEMYAVGKMLPSNLGWHHNQFLNDKALYGKRLLDIGCGSGAFLNEARKKGYDVWGLDFDRGNVQVAKERYGIEHIYVKSIEELSKDFSGQKFDVVTLFEVLEHLDEAIKFMRQLKELLVPEGYIAVSLPNRDRSIDMLGNGDYPPNHLTKWNKSSLCRFLENNGFEIVKSAIKKLDADEVAGFLKSKIRFGISKGLARRGIESKTDSDIRKAAFLLKSKDVVFKAFTILFLPVSLFSLQGTGLYVLARLKR